MIKIGPMKAEHLSTAISLWKVQFDRYCAGPAFPDFMGGGQRTVERYISEQIAAGNAVAATKSGELVGFMAWMYFDFHGEKTAFLPITGHAACLGHELNIYQQLYGFAAQKWVSDDRFNHLWMTYFDDTMLKNRLYDLGFGSYVIDACQSTGAAGGDGESEDWITVATEGEVKALTEFANTSGEYYAASPIFLKRYEHTQEEIKMLMEKGTVLLAWDQGKIIGALSFTFDQGFHFEHLTTPDSAYLGGIGAFIDPDYRGKGIGTALLKQAFECCRKRGTPFLHVSFESANPDAIRFWPKQFKPAIRSVRRTVNKDANR